MSPMVLMLGRECFGLIGDFYGVAAECFEGTTLFTILA